MSLKSLLLPITLLTAATNAHFTVTVPTPIGPFDEDNESTSPCGGVTIDFTKDNVTDFHVGGEPIAIFLGHTQANLLFRGTLDQTASSNWSELFPIVQQTGLGNLCEPSVTAPAAWAGKKGLVGIVANAPDGLLYQCAAVNFVTGTGTSTSDCKNSSSVTAAFVADTSLSALVGTSSNSTSTATASGTSTSSTASSTAKSSSAAVPAVMAPVGTGLAASAMVVVAMGLLGAGALL